MEIEFHFLNPQSISSAPVPVPAMLHRDYTLDLPDECLSLVFNSLSQSDRNKCSLVCHRWYRVEGQSRQRLSLHAASALEPLLPTLLTRFDSVTKLALKNDRRTDSISDDSLSFISTKLPRLTRLKLRSCKQITEQGISALATNCRWLRKISCASCSFGPTALAAILTSCPLLEDLSLKRLRGVINKGNGYTNSAEELLIGAGFTGSDSLRSICLKDLYNAQCFVQFLAGCKNLRTIKILRCSGPWDGSLDEISSRVPGITEVHLEKLQVSDKGLFCLSKCTDLEILHIVKTPECTDAGIAEIASKCHMLRKLHIDGWRTNRIGDLGLIEISKGCPKLQELVLVGVNPTFRSLDPIAGNCRQLERLAMCGCETVGDSEVACLGARCTMLRKLCIKGCPVSDNGLAALAQGCPSLVKVKLKRCGAVTPKCIEWLRAIRGEGFSISLDTMESQQEQDMDIVVGNETGAGDQMAEMIDGMATMDLTTGSQVAQQPRGGRMRALMLVAIRRFSGGAGPSGSNGANPGDNPPSASA
ncbi:F-box protein [Rhynchospora pubera]|uniref:F-box protein n=1 Tax=Rhynchospora pubera TaxID=906938 RepID=A0AAV8DDK0_9POAL|nr:F-box protein [Rhynchospora pubera]